MSVPEPQRRPLVILLELGATIVTLWLAQPNRPALRPFVLHHALRWTRRGERACQRAGELLFDAYRDAVDP